LDHIPSMNLVEAANLDPLFNTHVLGYSQKGQPVGSTEDWVERCPAGANTNVGNCPEPSAEAYDHVDSPLAVQKNIWLVDDNGVTPATELPKIVASVDYAALGTYLFKFQASDSAGNQAEEIVFALILDDTSPPVITLCDEEATVEAGSDTWALCSSDSAQDTMFDSVTPSLTYQVQDLNTGEFHPADGPTSHADVANWFDSTGKWKTHEYLVIVRAEDSAGVYGHAGTDNIRIASKKVTVVDTIGPNITVVGVVNPYIHQCGADFQDDGAIASDVLDDHNEVSIVVQASHSIPIRNEQIVSNYEVEYNARDAHMNQADPKTRVVNVVDTLPPTLTLQGQQTITHHAGEALNDPGVHCVDACSHVLNEAIATEWDKPFNDTTLDDYVKTYTCTDNAGLSSTIDRTFTVVDITAPIITVIENQVMYVEAELDKDYDDPGASCHDYVDKDISTRVTPGGELVQMSVPGTYTITYDCEDTNGNEASQQIRKVIVEDTTCPTISLVGDEVVTVEAGFAYVDAGATAEDTLDGTIAVTDDGNTVDTLQAFYSLGSCQEIRSEYPSSYGAAPSGEYFISLFDETRQKFLRMKVWCDMTESLAEALTLKPVVEMDGSPISNGQPWGGAASSCAAMGMVMFPGQAYSADSSQVLAAKEKFCANHAESDCEYIPTDQSAVSSSYLCTLSSTPSSMQHHSKVLSQNVTHEHISKAEIGKYVITYSATDSHGNVACDKPTRTVVVVDTLKPVITLSVNGQVIHRGDADDLGVGDVQNPAGQPQSIDNPDGNPYMAERSIVESNIQGWNVAAVACAVTGVALLGYALRNSARHAPNAWSVPV